MVNTYIYIYIYIYEKPFVQSRIRKLAILCTLSQALDDSETVSIRRQASRSTTLSLMVVMSGVSFLRLYSAKIRSRDSRGSGAFIVLCVPWFSAETKAMPQTGIDILRKWTNNQTRPTTKVILRLASSPWDASSVDSCFQAASSTTSFAALFAAPRSAEFLGAQRSATARLGVKRDYPTREEPSDRNEPRRDRFLGCASMIHQHKGRLLPQHCKTALRNHHFSHS